MEGSQCLLNWTSSLCCGAYYVFVPFETKKNYINLDPWVWASLSGQPMFIWTIISGIEMWQTSFAYNVGIRHLKPDKYCNHWAKIYYFKHHIVLYVFCLGHMCLPTWLIHFLNSLFVKNNLSQFHQNSSSSILEFCIFTYLLVSNFYYSHFKVYLANS